MDTAVMDAFEILTEQMRAVGYEESTIGQNKRVFSSLDRFCDGAPYTPNLGRMFLDCKRLDGKSYGGAYQKSRARAVSLMDGYLRTGSFDLAARRTITARLRPCSQALETALAEFEDDVEGRNFAKGTKCGYKDMARLLLVFAEAQHITCVSDIDADTLFGFMAHMRIVRPGTDSFYIASCARPFLKWLERDDLLAALRFTQPRRTRKISDVLSEDIEEALVEACCSGHVDEKDAALTLLALSTGLRAGDILNIRIGDIDWQRMLLSVVQSKTGNPVNLPLQPAVGEALAKYILQARAQTDDSHVFLKKKAPHTPLKASASIYQATQRALAAVGFEGGGTRLFRRNAATKMLRCGSQSSVISAVLGHARPATTDIYMSMDCESMRACVLPLSKKVKP